MLLLFLVMFTFCVLGIQMYGGLVTANEADPPYMKIEVGAHRGPGGTVGRSFHGTVCG